MKPKNIDEVLIALLHEFDKEPDEITKYVVIDQTKFVPEAKTQLKQIVDSIIGKDMTMKAAIKTHSDVGAGYTIGYNAAKAEQRKRAQEYGL